MLKMLKIQLSLVILICCVIFSVDGGRGGIRIGGFGFGSRSRPSPAGYPKQQWGSSRPSQVPNQPSRGVYPTGSRPNINRNKGLFSTNGRRGFGKYGGLGAGVGLGLGAGFLTGYTLGSFATFGLYHRYYEYQRMLYIHRNGYWTDEYYTKYYKSGKCLEDCPTNAHCTFGICECNAGYSQKFGTCYAKGESISGRPNNFDPFIPCTEGRNCQGLDMNLICNTTIPEGGKCECRRNMKWNKKTGQCDLYLDVDCTSVKENSDPSPVVEAANNATNVNETEATLESISNEQAASINVTLSNSILTQIDPANTTEDELKEAYCRDIDFFSNRYARYELPPEQADLAGAGIGIVVGVILAICVCCCCVTCCCMKKVKSIFTSFRNKDEHEDGDVQMTGNVAAAKKTSADHFQYPPQGMQYPPTQYQSNYLSSNNQAGNASGAASGFHLGGNNYSGNAGNLNPTFSSIGGEPAALPYPVNNGPAQPNSGVPAPYPPAADAGAAPYPPASGGAPPYPPATVGAAPAYPPYPPASAGAAPYPPASGGALPYPPSTTGTAPAYPPASAGAPPYPIAPADLAQQNYGNAPPPPYSQ